MLTEQHVKDVLKELESDANVGDIGINDKLSSVGIDSLDLFDVFLRLDEMTGVKVKDDDLAGLDTISKIIEYYNSQQ